MCDTILTFFAAVSSIGVIHGGVHALESAVIDIDVTAASIVTGAPSGGAWASFGGASGIGALASCGDGRGYRVSYSIGLIVFLSGTRLVY